MSSPKGFSATVTYVIYAAPDKVFDALTQEGLIGEWCEGGGSVSPESGGEFRLFGDWVKGSVLQFDKKKRKLSYTWKPSEWEQKTPPSVVEYTFKAHPAGTELVIEHTQFPSQKEAEKHASGWIDYVLEPLNDFFTR
jgi:uncharacterized protein YndB with AHSA1/START domain